jgi:hypothetical protein
MLFLLETKDWWELLKRILLAKNIWSGKNNSGTKIKNGNGLKLKNTIKKEMPGLL